MHDVNIFYLFSFNSSQLLFAENVNPNQCLEQSQVEKQFRNKNKIKIMFKIISIAFTNE